MTDLETMMYEEIDHNGGKYEGQSMLQEYHRNMAAYTEEVYTRVLDAAEHQDIEAAFEVVPILEDKKLSQMSVRHWAGDVEKKSSPPERSLRIRYVEQDVTAQQSNVGMELSSRSYKSQTSKRPASTFEESSGKSDLTIQYTGTLTSSDDSILYSPKRSIQLSAGRSHNSLSSEGSSSSEMDPAQAMTEDQVEHYRAIHEQTRRLQKQIDERNFAEETPARRESVKSVLRERNIINPGDVSMIPNVWSVPIGTVIPHPEWENAIEDKDYQKKLAIARTLPRNQPELYLPEHNVHPTLPPLNPRWKAHYFGQDGNSEEEAADPADRDDSSSVSDKLNEGQARAFRKLTAPSSPRLSSHQLAKWDQIQRITQSKTHVFRSEKDPDEKQYGALDHDGTFHALPAMPSPERIQQLEERKQNEPKQFPSPTISHEHQEDSVSDIPDTVAKRLDFGVRPKHTLQEQASSCQWTHESNLPSPMRSTKTHKGYNTLITRGHGSSPLKDNAKRTETSPHGKNLKKKSSLFNLNYSMLSDEIAKPVKEPNVTLDEEKEKHKAAPYTLKQSLSFTKLSEPDANADFTSETDQCKKNMSFSSFKRSLPFTKIKEPAKGFDPTFDNVGTEKCGRVRRLIERFSPIKSSNATIRTRQECAKTSNDTAVTDVLNDRLVINANRAKDSAVEPSFVTVDTPAKPGGLVEHLDQSSHNADDVRAADLEEANDSDEDDEEVMKRFYNTAFANTEQGKKQMHNEAEKEGGYPTSSPSAAIVSDETYTATMAAARCHHPRCNYIAEVSEARKLAEIRAVDAKRSEADRYTARAMGHAKPLSDAALSSHITTDEEKIVARGLGESIRIGQEEKTPTVNEEAELKEHVDRNTSTSGSKPTLRARMEKYPS